MKIGVIGATGHAGSKLYEEAKARGHEVTAIVRNAQKAQDMLGADAQILESDAFALTKADLTAFDVVIDGFAVGRFSGLGYLHVDLAAKLIHELRGTDKPRIFFLLGASSLKTASGRFLIEDLRNSPNSDQWIDVPEQQYREYLFLQLITDVNWVAVSPAGNFIPGDKSAYIRGTDQLLADSNGESILTTGNYAVAILDEIENPQVKQGRFTVNNK